MTRTTVNIDDDLLRAAQEVLGTDGVTETVNASLTETLRHARLANFSIRDFDITPDDVEEGRRSRR